MRIWWKKNEKNLSSTQHVRLIHTELYTLTMTTLNWTHGIALNDGTVMRDVFTCMIFNKPKKNAANLNRVCFKYKTTCKLQKRFWVALVAPLMIFSCEFFFAVTTESLMIQLYLVHSGLSDQAFIRRKKIFIL